VPRHQLHLPLFLEGGIPSLCEGRRAPAPAPLLRRLQMPVKVIEHNGRMWAQIRGVRGNGREVVLVVQEIDAKDKEKRKEQLTKLLEEAYAKAGI